MYKIAVIGDRDSIYGFAAIGVDVYPITDAVASAKKIRALAEGGYAIIYVTEALYAKLHAEEQSAAMLPIVLPIPGIAGNTGLGVARVRKFVEQAVGSDILFSDR
ncbi:MAG TPA: V-type ATP synthase subunit F [Clostridia bacterium]|jgi:V/A-type H+-transporting ATPase subunit F|nr:V-type ATP synthase subunit F [Clostridia bacterium]